MVMIRKGLGLTALHPWPKWLPVQTSSSQERHLILYDDYGALLWNRIIIINPKPFLTDS